VSDGLSSLKEEDVQRLARLIESLDASTFDYLQLRVGDLEVTIGKGALPVGGPVAAAPAPPAFAAPASPAHATPSPPAFAAPVQAAPVSAATGVPPSPPTAPTPPARATPSRNGVASDAAAGTIDIKSQIMGMFYSQPEPGSPPFVSIGAEVKEDTTVCLIEVMKTFNAMTAGVKGVITEICVKNAQLVEYGQVLFRIRPY
jgi:acetyl-CoA carboxylase biotin carboxyl carrier protein